MLEISDRPVDDIIDILARHGVEAGYLVPTSTGLEKSILDAHADLRDYLHLSGFHDYRKQLQGTSSKRIVEAVILSPFGEKHTQVSLYRPETKSGDPRIWIYGLKDDVNAGNLLAIFAHLGKLYVVNTSDRRMVTDQGYLSPNLSDLIQQIVSQSNHIAFSLLNNIKNIASQGWIQTLRDGPTGIGFTLETLLGISANSNKAPDYNGIEIKAGRITSGGKKLSRSTLFSKAPDWGKSTVHNGVSLLEKHGYRSIDGRLQLYCSLKNHPNNLGHYLAVQEDERVLNSMHQIPAINTPPNKVLHWNLDDLRQDLANKHKETFWVTASVRKNILGREEFLYNGVIHTKGPLLANVTEMFRQGHIELDYALHEKISINGSRGTRDHGYLFKMWPNQFHKLFPPPNKYALI